MSARLRLTPYKYSFLSFVLFFFFVTLREAHLAVSSDCSDLHKLLISRRYRKAEYFPKSSSSNVASLATRRIAQRRIVSVMLLYCRRMRVDITNPDTLSTRPSTYPLSPHDFLSSNFAICLPCRVNDHAIVSFVLLASNAKDSFLYYFLYGNFISSWIILRKCTSIYVSYYGKSDRSITYIIFYHVIKHPSLSTRDIMKQFIDIFIDIDTSKIPTN